MRKKSKALRKCMLSGLLCIIMLMGTSPSAVYAAWYNGDGVQSSGDGTQNGNVDGSYGGKVNRHGHGLIDTSKNGDYNLRGIYKGENELGDGEFYDTDISDQIITRENNTNAGQEILDWAWEFCLKQFGIQLDKQGAIADMLSNLIYDIAVSIHALLETVGVALDNVIFGRVGGNGVKVDDDTYISLFHFELEKGNPYGVIAAMIYSMIRKYMYVLMCVIAFIALIKVAINGDIPRAKLAFRERLSSMLKVLAMLVFMPYLLEVGLYVRDAMLKGIIGAENGMLSFFTSTETGLLEAFRLNCGTGILGLKDPPLMSSILYLAAVCISVILASMYVANALAMLIQVVSFPVVCVKSMFDNKAMSGWAWEMVGLASVPILDGILLMVPMFFNRAAGGTFGLNFVSLLCCCCMMTARQQFRRALGLQSNMAMESGGLMAAMGMSRLISSIGRAGKKAAGQLAGGLKQGASDEQMANYYDALDAQDRANKLDAEEQLKGGFFNSNSKGGVAENPAAKSGMGFDMGLGGGLSYKMQKLNESKTDARYEKASNEFMKNMRTMGGGMTIAREVVDEGTQGIFSVQEGVELREEDVKEAQIAAILGKNAPIKDDEVAKKFANIDNFESQEFANKLSNAKRAELYRQRAKHARRQGFMSSAMTLGGSAVGGVIGFGATAFMDSGTSAMITSAGIDIGSTAGSTASSISNILRQEKDASKERRIVGSGVELAYEIKQDASGTNLRTKDKYSKPTKYGEFMKANVEGVDNLPAAYGSETNGAVSVQAQTNYEHREGVLIEGHQMGAAAIGLHYDTNVSVEPNIGNEERFTNLMDSNPDLRQDYNQVAEDAIRKTWDSKELLWKGDGNYAKAIEASVEAKMMVNITPERKAKVNSEIMQLKNKTFNEVTSFVQEPMTKDFNNILASKGITLSSLDQGAVDERTKTFATSTAMNYMNDKMWDFDSLMLE